MSRETVGSLVPGEWLAPHPWLRERRLWERGCGWPPGGFPFFGQLLHLCSEAPVGCHSKGWWQHLTPLPLMPGYEDRAICLVQQKVLEQRVKRKLNEPSTLSTQCKARAFNFWRHRLKGREPRIISSTHKQHGIFMKDRKPRSSTVSVPLSLIPVVWFIGTEQWCFPALEDSSLSMQFTDSQPSLVAQLVKNPPATLEKLHCWEDPLGKGKATHSGILAWRIPWIV